MFDSKYMCDRCEQSSAVRLKINFIRKEEKEQSVVDLCPDCAYYGFGLLLKRLPKKDVDNWLEQFKQGIIS